MTELGIRRPFGLTRAQWKSCVSTAVSLPVMGWLWAGQIARGAAPRFTALITLREIWLTSGHVVRPLGVDDNCPRSSPYGG